MLWERLLSGARNGVVYDTAADSAKSRATHIKVSSKWLWHMKCWHRMLLIWPAWPTAPPGSLTCRQQQRVSDPLCFQAEHHAGGCSWCFGHQIRISTVA